MAKKAGKAEKFIGVKGVNGGEGFFPVKFFSKANSLLRISSPSDLKVGDSIVYRGKPRTYSKSVVDLHKAYERKASTFLDKGKRCEVVSTNTKAKEIDIKHV
ncbi:MAG: hypothetical protein ACOYMB_00075 [Patescibacteria group bacterium]